VLGGPDSTPSATGGSKGRSSSAAARWAALPKGFRPWQSSVYGKAAHGPGPLSLGDGGPACQLSDGALYCGGNGTQEVRVDPVTGRLLWRADLAPKRATWDAYDGTLAGVSGDVVVVWETIGSGLSSSGPSYRVSALDAASGRRLWSHPLPDDSRLAEPVVAGGVVLAPSDDGRSVVARSPRDGATRWTLPLPAGYTCAFYDIDHRPYGICNSFGDQPTDSVYLSVDPSDGAVRRSTGPVLDDSVAGVLDGRLLFLESDDSEELISGESPMTRIVSLDPLTGTQRTTKLARPLHGEAALVGSTLFVAGTGEVTALSPQTGKALWHTETTLEQPGRPAVDRWGRTLYTVSPTGRAAALDAARGKLLWESYPRAPQSTNGSLSEAYAVEGALVMLTGDGQLFGIDPGHPERKPASG
jgi:outer membrane protein assembly factor BamB